MKIQAEAQTISQIVDVNLQPNAHGDLVQSVSVAIDKNLVRLWWPNGYGEQPLYDVTVAFSSGLDINDVVTKTVKIGIRTVELVEDALGKIGWLQNRILLNLPTYFRHWSYILFQNQRHAHLYQGFQRNSHQYTARIGPRPPNYKISLAKHQRC